MEDNLQYLSFIDREIDALENLLPGFRNHGREIFDFKQELLLAMTTGSWGRVEGGEAGAEGSEMPASMVRAETEGASGSERK